MVDEITPIVPEGTPLPTPPVGVPPYPITPFAVWTWDSPVIPSFYWNIYSAEQRVKMICKEIGRIEAYLNYLVNKTNENLVDLQSQITKLDTRLTALEKKLAEEVARLDALIAKLREDLTAETKARQDGDEALDSKITAESTKLHGEISKETQDRIHADDSLHGEITAETQARQDADTDLESRVRADLATETQAREAGDAALGDRITAESEKLHGEVSAEAQARIHSDDQLHGEISKEVQDRQAADTALKTALEKELSDGNSSLHTEIATETQSRKDADAALEAKLAGEISTEAKAREDADKALGERITAEVSKEVQDRTHADDSLHGEISTETQSRQDADSALEAKLTTAIAKRLLPTEVTAGNEIEITQPDPNSNRIVIASTVAHSISDLSSEVSGVKAALEAEVSERRAEDSKLWQAVNQRLERGKLLAGAGIEVVNDPDQSTVTVSAKVTESKLDAVEAKAEAATTTAGEAKSTAEAAQATATGAESKAEAAQATATGAEGKAEQALTAAQGSLKTVAHNASLTGDGTNSTPLSLTPATATTLGGVKVGSGLAVTSDGLLSATAQGGSGSYVLPVATEETLGGVKIGVGLAVEEDGTLSATEDTHEGEGAESTAVGDSASATGSEATALGKHSSAEGDKSLALGYNAKGTGESTVAIGEGAEAKTKGSTAVGFSTVTMDRYGTAVGYQAKTYGGQAVALGSDSKAESGFSVVIGDEAEAQGEYGVSLGQGASANAKASVAIGAGSLADAENTVSFGTGGNASSGKPATRRLVNLSDPVNDQDAATKAYVDAHSGSASTTTVSGTAPVTVSGTPEAGYTIGVAAAAERTPGVITEARVKELSNIVATYLSGNEKEWQVGESTVSEEKFSMNKPNGIELVSGYLPGRPEWAISTNAIFYIKTASSSAWTEALPGAFETFTHKENGGIEIYARPTAYGFGLYGPSGSSKATSVKVSYSLLILKPQS